MINEIRKHYKLSAQFGLILEDLYTLLDPCVALCYSLYVKPQKTFYYYAEVFGMN